MKKIMEQKTQQNKKSKLNVPTMVLSGLLVTGALAGFAMAFTGCPNLSVPGGNEITNNLLEQNVWPYDKNVANWKHFTSGNWETEKDPKSATEPGLGRWYGTEYKVDIYENGAVRSASNETRAYIPSPGSYWSDALGTFVQVPAQNTHLMETCEIPYGKKLLANGEFEIDNGVIVLPTGSVADPKMPNVDDGMGGLSPSVPTARIIQRSSSGNGIHDMAGIGGAYIAIQGTGSPEVKSILPELSLQAKKLYDFFNAVQGGGAKFTNLKNYEKAMLGNSSSTVNSFLSAMDEKGDAIIDEIFGPVGPENTARAEFDKYFDAYSAGHHLIARDWDTEGTVDTVTLSERENYKTLRGLINQNYNTGVGTHFLNSYDNGVTLDIGNIGTFNLQTGEMQAVMRGQIIEALGLDGLTGDQQTAAQQMADALIIQLGQDREELRAFKDDLTAEADEEKGNRPAFAQALNYQVGSGMQTVAQAGTQSNVRLARLDDGAAFSPELVKGAYGTKYTGSFTPYKKDENGLA
jgi:hypothetical protein